MLYRNNSSVTKTFYGVTFHPGDVKYVSGYINNLYFTPVMSMPKEPPKRVEPIKKGPSQPVKKPEATKDSERKIEKAIEINVENGGDLNGEDSNK